MPALALAASACSALGAVRWRAVGVDDRYGPYPPGTMLREIPVAS